MKMFFIIILFCFNIAFAQTHPRPVQNKYNKALETFNVITINDTYEIGELDINEDVKMIVSVYNIYTLENKDKAFKVVKIVLKKLKSAGETSAFIDSDEMRSVSAALSNTVNTANKWSEKEFNSSDLSYRTKDYFEFGFTQVGKIQSAYVGIKDDADYLEYEFIKLEYLPSIKQLFDKAINKLNTK